MYSHSYQNARKFNIIPVKCRVSLADILKVLFVFIWGENH